MSKKRREKMKAKAARHSKPEREEASGKAAKPEPAKVSQKTARPQQRGAEAAINRPAHRSKVLPESVAEAPAGRDKKTKASKESLDANDAPHLKEMSSSWRAFYEEIARKAKA
jgi:hypothetical protein